MAALNRRTFGRQGPTNVIAFPMDAAEAPPGGPPSPTAPPVALGEVVISVETTARQAAEQGWPPEELLDFYLIHGILHLLGYDHGTPEEEALMEAKSWELIEVLRSPEAGAGDGD